MKVARGPVRFKISPLEVICRGGVSSGFIGLSEDFARFGNSTQLSDSIFGPHREP